MTINWISQIPDFLSSNQRVCPQVLYILIPDRMDDKGPRPSRGKNWYESLAIELRLPLPYFFPQSKLVFFYLLLSSL